MKKKLLIILIAVLALTAVVFCVLWRQEATDNSQALSLAQSGAREALERFSDYQESGAESDYWDGVAAFRSFQQAYYLLVEGTNKIPNYTFCNEVYGCLLLSPEKSREHISEIISVMAILAADVRDENGYLAMAELRNVLQA